MDSRPPKRTKLLSDDEASDNDAGVPIQTKKHGGGGKSSETSIPELQINEEFARRFQHNKQREERQRLEEKYQDEDDDSSTSESEDDEGELATQELDSEIFATLNALKSKDPRIYDKSATFYRPVEDGEAENGPEEKKQKPMYLQDYHRQNLMNGNSNDEASAPRPTYAEEQEALKRDVVSQMHAAGEDDADADEPEADDFLVKKKKAAHMKYPDAAPVRQQKAKALDVKSAEKDPETFLSNFMAARAWVPEGPSRYEGLESDDSEEDKRADAFEEAYNMRFEDPKGANEKLMTYGRDLGNYSVRREDLSGRKKQREKERAVKEAAREQRRDEKARLRRLRIDEVEKKVQQIREAAGLRPDETVDLEQWSRVLEEDWDDERWVKELESRFGDEYYAQKDSHFGTDENSESRKAHKKPKWDDDIDIKDLDPTFEDEDVAERPTFALTDDEGEEEQAAEADGADDNNANEHHEPARRSGKQSKAEQKRASRLQRRAIESLVDSQLVADVTAIPSSSKPGPSTTSNGATPSATTSGTAPSFRYRETSPSAFGLTARDILFADDSQLNEFAGLKKLAAFRDEEKKRNDRRKLSKKARLRQWRRDTFGNEEGFTGGFKEFLGDNEQDDPQESTKRKRKGTRDESARVNGDAKGESNKKRKRKSKAGR